MWGLRFQLSTLRVMGGNKYISTPKSDQLAFNYIKNDDDDWRRGCGDDEVSRVEGKGESAYLRFITYFPGCRGLGAN